MIIDAYPSAFAPWDTRQGFPTLKERMSIVQRELGGHHQQAWRVRDRQPVDNSSLIDPGTGELTEVEWTRHNGQLAWRYQDEVYTKQYFPPMLQDFECPPELMIAEMDYAGVDMGILHCYVTKGHYRTQNGFQRQSVRRHPDRLMRTIMVSEPEVPEDPDRALREVQEEVDFGGHTAVQFIPRNYYAPIVPSLKGMGRTEPWDDEVMRPFWDGVASMKVPVFFTILGRGGALRDRYGHSALDEYFEEQRVLLRWMERYPEVTVVITHGLPWRAFLEGDRVEFPEHIWDVFKAPQLNMEMIIPIQMGGMWEYPWEEAEATIKECVDRTGADRLMWGSDWPMVGRYCTYAQNLNQYKLYCDFLSKEERASIIGGTAARIMGIEESA